MLTVSDNHIVLGGGGGGGGDVVGAASSTDNAIARFDGVTGKLVQNSSVTIDDSGGVVFATGTGIISDGAVVGTAKQLSIHCNTTHTPELVLRGNSASENSLPSMRLDYRQTPLTGDKLAFFGRGGFSLPNTNTVYLGSIVNSAPAASSYNFGILLSSTTRSRYELALFDAENARLGILTSTPTATLDINSDTMRLRIAKTPASASAAGNQGDICRDANYMYVCVAANTWKRSALATW